MRWALTVQFAESLLLSTTIDYRQSVLFAILNYQPMSFCRLKTVLFNAHHWIYTYCFIWKWAESMCSALTQPRATPNTNSSKMDYDNKHCIYHPNSALWSSIPPSITLLHPCTTQKSLPFTYSPTTGWSSLFQPCSHHFCCPFKLRHLQMKSQKYVCWWFRW